MCSQDPVCSAPVLRNSGLPVGGRWDEHHVAGSGEGAPGEESGHGVAPGEPDRQRRHSNGMSTARPWCSKSLTW